MSRTAGTAGPRWLPAIAFGVACTAQAAAPGNDPFAWLQRAAAAANAANYAGTFVHTNGDRTATFRITHLNLNGEENERIEPLDGPPIEIVRKNDEMFCRFPDAKTVRLDSKLTARYFPAVLRATPEAIAASYDVSLGKSERILGYECQWVRLSPRDSLRFEQRLCSEAGTGLVIRAKTLNGERQVIEQYTFTDLRLGPQAGRAAEMRSSFEARLRQWRADRQPREDAKAADTGWMVNAPPGFQKVTEIRRTLPGRQQPVSQIVLTDGLASVSVFVEPNMSPARTAEASSEDGTTTFFSRPMGDQVVTVLGEVPLVTAQQVGRSVSRRP